MTPECVFKCFVLPALVAIPFGFIGAWIGRGVGAVASHSFSWLLMFFASGATYLTIALLENPGRFAVDFQQGASVSAIILGLYVATPLEFLRSVAVQVFSRWSKPIEFPDIPEGDGHIQSFPDDNPYSPPRSAVK